MIRMPAIGEPESAARSRVRFQEPPVDEPDDSVDPDGSESSTTDSSAGGSHGFELQEDPSFWKDHNVQVVIRIRPLSGAEISMQGHNRCVRQESYQTVTWTGHPENRFTFDLVADEHVTQEKLFKVAGVPMVENCVAGYNSCMFAYGQTGSGKTHTMLGDIEGGTRRHSVNCGMTPRVFEYMFSRIQKEKESRRDEKLQFTCRCSFLEIYNEQILDLLDPSSANLQLREDAKKGVHVENLTEFEVSSARDVMQQLIQGSANRKVAATNMNRASSRSHSVFTCVIESKWEAQGVTHHRFSRLNLVDLAGSERQKSSGAEGDRLKEATNINKSLSTLGLVIMNLVSISNKKSLHVPYRDSKLTFLLQDSLGGNSKTIIIANISPSNCCSLETLSTLKFAQRAKFIRNNAIVNEDASGDVLAMRLQIQQLKKEVSRLQGLANGGSENSGTDGVTSYILGSPGQFKWDWQQGSFSPLSFEKRLSQRKEYEAALVAAFRRDQEKVVTLKALAAEKQAAELLATQRTEEVRGLKMRLRFREEGIKRLEAVNRGKLSAETHLLQEKEELMKEIEALRNQVDRNPEITRFAMENLHLKEEFRRLQSFVEEGEREMLNEQLTVLQDKLLEALDWKLMHEKDVEVAKDRLSLTLGSSANEENEFLHLQAIQHQREVEALRKNLTFSLEAKEKLERRVDELVSQLEEQRMFFSNPSEETLNPKNSDPILLETNEVPDHQMELKTMVDAIAAASQREAEAHETAIMLDKENEDLRMKIKILIEDNNKLIELYDGAVSGRASNPASCSLEVNNTGVQEKSLEDYVMDEPQNLKHENDFKDAKDDVEYLQIQLHDMHEENERLLGLYETAMQERDEYKRRLSYDFNGAETEKEIKCEVNQCQVKDEAVIQKQGDGNLEDLMSLYDKVVHERDEYKRILSSYGLSDVELREETRCVNKPVQGEGDVQMQDEKKLTEISEETMYHLTSKLKLVQDKLAATGNSVKYFQLLEKAAFDVDEILEKIDYLDHSIQHKKQEIAALRDSLPETQVRANVAQGKLLALKAALQSISSQDHFWDKREEQARARVESSSRILEQKNEEIRNLVTRKEEADTLWRKAQQSESELRSRIEHLKMKLQGAEAQKKESEKVLFAIDNKPELFSQQRTVNLGKASEMLKSEETRCQVSTEMKQLKEQLAILQKQIADCRRTSDTLDSAIRSLEARIEGQSQLMQEAELRLQDVVLERETLCNVREDGKTTELSNILVEYQECIFELLLKEEEIKLCKHSLKLDTEGLEELRSKKMVATQNFNNLREESKSILMLSYSDDNTQYISQRIEEELGDIHKSLCEAKLLLSSDS